MSDLVTRAELVKLARVLRTTPEQVHPLESLGAQGLAELRAQISAALFDEHARRFRVLADLSMLAPAVLVAKISEHVVGPVLSARVAGLVSPWRASKMAEKMSTSFLADMSVHLDPRHVRAVIDQMATRTVVDVAHELLRRGDHITIGRFVDSVRDDVIRAVLAAVDDDESLLRAVFYMESPGHLEKLVRLLRAERLARFVSLGVTGPTDVRLAGLSLMGRVGRGLRVRLADLAVSDQPEEALIGFLDTALAEDAVGELLTVVTNVSPALQPKMDRVVERLSPGQLRTLVRAAITGPDRSRVAALILINRVDDRLKTRLADLAAEEPEETLAGFLATAVDMGGVAELLTTVTHVSPQWQPKMDRVVERLSPERLRALVLTAMGGHEASRMAALSVMGRVESGLRSRLADLAAEAPENTLGGFLDTAVDQGAVAELLTTVTHVDPSWQDKLDRVIAETSAERLQMLVHTAMTGPEPIRLTALALIGRAGDAVKTLLADLAAQEPENVLDDFLATAVQHGSLTDVLATVAHVSPSSQATMDRVIERLSSTQLQALVHAAMTGSDATRVEGLHLIGRVDDRLKTRLADLATEEPAQNLDGFLATAMRYDAVGDLLATITHLSRSRLERIVHLPVLNDPAVLDVLVRTAVERGLWPELLPVLRMVPAMKGKSLDAGPQGP